MYLYKSKAFSITIDPFFLILPPIMLFCGYLAEFITVFLSTFLHELGHIMAAIVMKRRINTVRVLPVGLNALIESNVGPRWQNVIMYLGGPVTNLLLSALPLIIYAGVTANSDKIHFFTLINIYLAVFNMIPILPLDGGRILNEMLSGRVGLFLASRYLQRISICLSVVLLALGILQFIWNNRNFSLLMIGVYICFVSRFEERSVALLNMKNIIYRHSRIRKKGVYAARDLVVMKSLNIGDVIKNMDFDRFHIIYVLDDDLKLIKILTEQDVIDGMMEYGGEITFSEFVSKISIKSTGFSQYTDGNLT